MVRRSTPFLLALACVLVGALWAPPQQVRAATTPLFRHENGYLLTGPFLAYYEANGGAAVFGKPRSDQFIEPGGLTVQYFDYARFEWHDYVALTHLGRMAADEISPVPDAFTWRAPNDPHPQGYHYFPESGHTLGGGLLDYWQEHGQLAVFGYPISEEFDAPQEDGTTIRTQYFERAVLTYHPESDGSPDEVRRVPLGAMFAPERPKTPAPTVLAEASLPFRPGSGDGENITLAVTKLHGIALEPGERLSFLSAIGPITEENGYVGGSAIVGGEIVNNAIGGGVCAVSTLVYRAAWHAGLEVLERRGHSFWLGLYADQPGLESAVDDPSLDLVIKNDTPSPVFVEALTANGVATLRLWGVSDGRKVTVDRPIVRSNAASASAPGSIVPATDPREVGATVINTRIVTVPGKAPRVERATTVYKPVPASDEDA